MPKLTALIFLLSPLWVSASDPFQKNDHIDILHYQFQLTLNDTSDVITGQAVITILVRKTVSEILLDLTGKNPQGRGMQVALVTLQGRSLNFVHQNDQIKIALPTTSLPQGKLEITVTYSGVPQDGLIIGKNKFGDRTFFGDNWPDRAHHWLPCVDHPSDKATCEFIVIAPDHYQVVANGKKVEQSRWLKNQMLTHWQETIPIPMKVMAIGVARFAIREAGRVGNIPVESWVYPQDSTAGFSDYAAAVKILEYLQRTIGPYPYEKLANVESTTRYGGMENASNIFYAENTVDGKNVHEELIAHETAHQWFGNSATEADWHHVWLSESFATYFSHLYLGSAYGNNRLIQEELKDRKTALDYFRKNQGPVIDTSVVELMKLLNPNSYEKGGWVLHMLRHEVGDTAFYHGIRKYYSTYRNDNALTDDFRKIMEEVSKRDLGVFFNQWIWRGGHPKITGSWKYNGKSKTVKINISQNQAGAPFTTPMDIGLRTEDGTKIHTVNLTSKMQEFSLPCAKKPLDVVPDPMTWLFFEGEVLPR